LPRLVIKNWARANGKVRYVDLRDPDGAPLRHSYPDSFGVADEPFPDHVEAALGSEIETPLGEYIARCKKAAGGVLVDTHVDRERRAIILALMTQALRNGAAFGDLDGVTDLVRSVERGKDYLSDVAKRWSAGFAFVGVNVDGPLYLPSSGIFGVPMVGGVGWALPLTPYTFVAAVPRDAEQHAFLHWREDFAMLSVGVRGDRVALPPDKDLPVAWVREVRACALDIARAHQLANVFLNLLAATVNR
jgi:hypothetical protein